MINRELIRIKIVQLTYAYYQNGNKLMDSAEKELLFSLSKASICTIIFWNSSLPSHRRNASV